MSDFATLADFAGKVEWEGGVLEAIDYGLHAADVPDGNDQLKQLWAQLEAGIAGLNPLVTQIEQLLGVPEFNDH